VHRRKLASLSLLAEIPCINMTYLISINIYNKLAICSSYHYYHSYLHPSPDDDDDDCAAAFPDTTFSTTVLKLEQSGHCTPKKCQLRFVLFTSQSLHIIFTIRAKSDGIGCISISCARACHAALMDDWDTTVFLQIGQLRV
jgi:hypothetical protein